MGEEKVLPKAHTLTESQNKVFNFIAKFIDEHRRPPSVREIAKKMNYASTNAVADVLKALESKSYISRRGGARNLVVLYKDEFSQFGLSRPAEDQVSQVPIVVLDRTGKSYTFRNRSTLYIDKSLLGNGEYFLAFTGDDGMNSSGILKGDLVLVEKRSIANSEKNLLVCVSDDEDFIVRSFAFANNRIQLLPSNRTYLTKEIKPTDKNSNTIIFGEVRLTIRKTKK